jgi:uncharacterized protein
MKKVKFEWDQKKSSTNLKKHGVAFEEAQTCFEDDYAEIFDDEKHSDTEERSILLGMSTALKTLVVVFTERIYEGEKEIINRIISARKATKTEFQYYWNRRQGK